MSENEDVFAQSLLATAPIGNRHALPVAFASGSPTLKVAIVDRISFTRDCIALSIGNLALHLSCAESIETRKFASYDDLLVSENCFTTIVYHFQGLPGESLSDLRKFTEAAAPVIVLSQDESMETIRAAFEFGARGYIPTRDAGLDLLITVLSFVNAGGTFVPSSVLVRIELSPKHSHGLTEREMLILGLLKKGKQNKLIAYELGLSESTVKVHVRNILSKLHVKNRTEAVSAAVLLISDGNQEELNKQSCLEAELNCRKRIQERSALCNKNVSVAVSDYNQRRQAARFRALAESATTPALKARLLKGAAN
jgi:DNA-binding NarL/FixJ family response regulator